MAIINCRECGKEASSNAKACPHCGVKTPSRGEYWAGIVGKIAFTVIAVTALSSEPSRAFFSQLLNKVAAKQNCEVTAINFSHETFVVSGEPDYGIKAYVDIRNKSGKSVSGKLNVRLETSEGDFTREGNVALEPNASRRIEVDFHEPTLGVKNVVGKAICTG